jgi:hypothetical protein
VVWIVGSTGAGAAVSRDRHFAFDHDWRRYCGGVTRKMVPQNGAVQLLPSAVEVVP